MSTPVVAVKNATKIFNEGESNQTIALKDVDLDIGSNEFVSIIGPSGCGKSTLMRLVGDLIRPTHGSIQVNGKSAQQARLDLEYGIVFQAPVLYEWRTIIQNVKLPLELRKVDSAEQEIAARKMLDLVELTEFESHYPWQLSGGMQQRAAIARALVTDPALLLMDEPFGALDEMTRERMNLELRDIWERTGSTILFITHSIAEAVFMSTKVVVMSARPGQITQIIDIDLPAQRDSLVRESSRYFELVNQVREGLRDGDAQPAPK